MSILILGAGHAGARTAEALRKAGCDAPIRLVGEEPDAPYERPPLSKDSMEVAPIGGGAAHWTALGVELLTGARVAALDLAAKRALLADGTALGWDRLVLATGSRARRLPALHREGLPVEVLRTRADAAAIRARLLPGATLLCVGGGVIGLEVAACAVARGCRAVVVEAGPRLMGRSAPPRFAARLHALHAEKGVEIRLDTGVERVAPAAAGLAATLSDGSRVEAALCVVGVGAEPEEGLARAAGLPCDGGVLVDGQGRTAHPDVFAVGEVARHPLPRFATTLRQETWRHAETHPRSVAAALLDPAAPAYDEVPGFWSDQHGHRFLLEGLPDGIEVERGAASFWLDPADGRLRGAACLDDAKLMAVARRLIAAGARPDRARLADPDTDPRALLRG